MKFLEAYLKEYGDTYHKWEIERAGFLWFSIAFGISYLISKRVVLSLFLGFVFVWLITQESPRMSISKDGCTLRIVNPTTDKGFPKMLLPRYVMSVVYRLIFPGEKTYDDVKRVSCSILNMSSPEVVLRVPSPILSRTRRQIIITNHVHTPIRDAFSFFAFIPPSSELIVVQHNFHWFVTMVSKRLYGAWTIDKDDKSASGKKNMVNGLTKLLMYMRTRNDCTVVMYPAGKVPKTADETIGKFYPGAFYLALMSGYFITPLVNRYTKEGVFSSTLYPSVDVCSEYDSRIEPKDKIEDFRISNSDVLNEMCDRFRNFFLFGPDQIENPDQIKGAPLHGTDVGTRVDDRPLP
jgi:hypothetical protein